MQAQCDVALARLDELRQATSNSSNIRRQMNVRQPITGIRRLYGDAGAGTARIGDRSTAAPSAP
jgi:hypothetical protein